MNDTDFDRLLHIKTVGTLEVLNQSVHYNRYEATPYQALDEFFLNYELKNTDSVVDFGSGKGRLPFYINYHCSAPVIGIEMSNKLHREALENLDDYMRKAKHKIHSITFEKCMAQEYEIKARDNVFYFFNPFSVQIFMKVVENILQSADQHERTIDLILYYPTTAYIQFLETRTTFEFVKEVKVSGLYERNENERFLIFRLRVNE
jgi:SAM-dependent methyltransferase